MLLVVSIWLVWQRGALRVIDDKAEGESVSADGVFEDAEQIGAEKQIGAVDGWFKGVEAAVVDKETAPLAAYKCWPVVVDQDVPERRDFRPEAKERNDFDLRDEGEMLQSDAAIPMRGTSLILVVGESGERTLDGAQNCLGVLGVGPRRELVIADGPQVRWAAGQHRALGGGCVAACFESGCDE